MEIETPVPLIRTSYGRVCVEWDAGTLNRVLAQLRCERDRHNAEIATSISEARHHALMREAEAIKHETEQHISKRKAPA